MDKERLIIIAISALIGLIIIATAVILIVRTYTDMPEDTAQSSAITPAGDTTSAPFETSGTSADSYGTDSSPHEQATSGSTPADSGTNAPESAQITSSNAENHSITTASPVTSEAPITTAPQVTTASPVTTEAPVTTQPTETSAITEADTSSPAETTYPDGVTGGKHTFVISADSKGSFRLLSNTGKMDDRIYPASLTKLVTALTVLEYAGNRLDDVITVGETELKLVKAGSSLADLSAGMKLTVRQMLECMLIPSGNDAAYVLASYVGGLIDPSAKTASQRVSVFVGKMNEWSASNALMNSSWKNPDGYHADGHYTSMNDMVVIVMQTINNKLLKSIVSSGAKTVPLISGGELFIKCTNLLLDSESRYFNPACTGIKTGYTAKAGNCLVSSFEKDGVIYYIGLFGITDANDRFVQANSLFDLYSAG